MPQFHETMMGRKFFEVDFPRLVEAIAKIARGYEDVRIKEREMNKEMFERELAEIENSFRFKNMLEYNPDLLPTAVPVEEQHVKKLAVIYHAFSVGCNGDLLDNPLTIGGYVRRTMENSSLITVFVTEARSEWGPK